MIYVDMPQIQDEIDENTVAFKTNASKVEEQELEALDINKQDTLKLEADHREVTNNEIHHNPDFDLS